MAGNENTNIKIIQNALFLSDVVLAFRSYRLKLHKDMLQLFVQFFGRVLADNFRNSGKEEKMDPPLWIWLRPPKKIEIMIFPIASPNC